MEIARMIMVTSYTNKHQDNRKVSQWIGGLTYAQLRESQVQVREARVTKA